MKTECTFWFWDKSASLMTNFIENDPNKLKYNKLKNL